MYESTKITIIGAGLMGCGIAQVFAAKGLPVVLFDPIEQARKSAIDRIRDTLTLVQQDPAIASGIHICDDLATAVVDADLVIEAAPEKIEVKRNLFSQMLGMVKSSCILASNTSVIPIGEIADGMNFAGRIVGTHWWNPPFLVPLVEVVQSNQTSYETINTMMALLKYVGKAPAHIEKDVPGFVGNRLQHALWREAIALINDGVCTPQTLDHVVKNSFGMRLPVLGPMENADLIGLDLTQDIHDVILRCLNRDLLPAKVLQQKVDRGQLGVKTGQGFMPWSAEQTQQLRANLVNHLLNATQTDRGN